MSAEPAGVGAPTESDRCELSVIIPAYNAATTLPAQLDALTRHAPPFAYEILVCDNGSADDTARIVGEWAVRVPVRLVDASARRGPAAARNIGASVARSPKLAFCDADDVVGDGWLAGMSAALDAHEFVAGSFEFALLNEGFNTPGLWTSQSQSLTHKPYLPQFAVAGSGNMGIRRAVFDQVGGFFEPLRTAEDDDLCLRVQLAGHRLVFLPELVLHVRRRDGLWSLCRQAYTYAVGEKRLRYRYADVELPSDPEIPSGSPDVDAAAESSPHRARLDAPFRRAIRKIVRVRSSADLAPVLWRWTWRIGWSLAREDTRIPRITAPTGSGPR